MNFYLKLDAFALFIVVMLPGFILMMIPLEERSGVFAGTLSLISMGVLLGWFYSIGFTFFKKLRDKRGLNLRLLRIASVYPFVLVLIVLLFQDLLKKDAGVAFMLVLSALVSIFYCMRFAAKAIASFERKESVGFGDYAGNFFLMWFFPLGVWFVQPKVGKLLERK
jgi:hypothetical protein